MNPEQDLAIAVLKLAWLDARSRLHWVRRAALAFWEDGQALALWNDLLDLPEGTLHRRAVQVLQGVEPLAAWPEQLALFATGDDR